MSVADVGKLRSADVNDCPAVGPECVSRFFARASTSVGDCLRALRCLCAVRCSFQGGPAALRSRRTTPAVSMTTADVQILGAPTALDPF